MANAKLIQSGTREYKRVNLALFFAGFVTFSTLYTFQPLFPNLVRDFGISPAIASLSLSFATFALAWTLPVSGTLSDIFGRRHIMSIALIFAPLLAFACTAVETLSILLSLRFVQGIVLAGVPAVAMAYLNDEIDPSAVNNAMGIYIAGNAFGGMTGRILTSLLTDYTSWRFAVCVISLIGLFLGIVFIVMLPASSNFKRKQLHLGQQMESLLGHLQNPRLLCLFLVAFTCMGSFVTLYNYVTFRLIGTEFNLSQTQAASIFLAYSFGAFGSSAVGLLVNRFGQSPTLFFCLAVMLTGLLFTMFSNILMLVCGIVVFTIGFFGAHVVASTWVGIQATESRAQASSLYLLAYYLGSSVSGTGGGFFYNLWGWSGVVLLDLILIFFSGLAALCLISKAQENVTVRACLEQTEL